MANNKSLHTAKATQNDEFYTGRNHVKRLANAGLFFLQQTIFPVEKSNILNFFGII